MLHETPPFLGATSAEVDATGYLVACGALPLAGPLTGNIP